jgi:hypothetical protein
MKMEMVGFAKICERSYGPSSRFYLTASDDRVNNVFS